MQKKVFSFIRPYKKECIAAPFFKLLEAVFELLVPLVVASIIDKGIALGNMSYTFWMTGLLLLLALTGLAFSITAQYFSARSASLFARDLRAALFAHILSFSKREMEDFGSSTLITRMNGDMNMVQSGFNLTLRLLLRSPFVVFGAAVMAFIVSPAASVIFFISIALLSFIIAFLLRLSIKRFRLVQEKLDSVTAVTKENIDGNRVIRAFSLEENEKRRFDEENTGMKNFQLFSSRVSSLTSPLTSLVINLAIIALIYFGAINVDMGNLTQGQVIALINYMSQILVELIKLANLIISISKALASASRIEKVFSVSPTMTFGTLSSFSGEDAITFKDVCFSYNGKNDVLKDISFSIKKGMRVGIIGGTGSGKSTLALLICRLYDRGSGSIMLFGKDIKEYSQEFLRSRISFAAQKARLFSGSIKSNLDFASGSVPYSEALHLSCAEEFVEKKGLDAPLERNAGNLSGGQRQRLSLARALMKKADIIILDDTFSALDYKTDLELRRNLSTLDATKIIISQRIKSIADSDMILVLDNGVLVSSGTHEELLSTSSFYREIYNSQTKEEENV